MVEEALTERVLYESFSDFVHVNNPNTAEAQWKKWKLCQSDYIVN